MECCMVAKAMEKLLDSSWYVALEKEFASPYMASLSEFVRSERSSGAIYPPSDQVFSSLQLCPLKDVRVVIVGQDPYHGPGQAHGLSFSVQPGIATPPSLQNIFKEIKEDLGIEPPKHGCLEAWAKQGVLLLNAVLTVRHKSPGSHAGQGWERLTDAICRAVAEREVPTVFLLWGKFAQNKLREALSGIDTSRHLILCAAHPSPFAAYSGFFGCRHFSKANDFLKKSGFDPINWDLK